MTPRIPAHQAADLARLVAHHVEVFGDLDLEAALAWAHEWLDPL